MRDERQCSLRREPELTNCEHTPTEAKGRHAMVRKGPDKQKNMRIGTSRERAVVRDILAEKHRPKKKTLEVCVVGTRFIKESGARLFWLIVLQCNQLRTREQRAVRTKNPHQTKRVLDSAEPTNQF